MKRELWVPLNLTYEEYMSNEEIRKANQDIFNAELLSSSTLAMGTLQPGSFLYFRECIRKELEKIADDTTTVDDFMKRSIALVGERLKVGGLMLTEGEALSLGIELGQFVVAIALAERMEKVFGSFDPKGGNE